MGSAGDVPPTCRARSPRKRWRSQAMAAPGGGLLVYSEEQVPNVNFPPSFPRNDDLRRLPPSPHLKTNRATACNGTQQRSARGGLPPGQPSRFWNHGQPGNTASPRTLPQPSGKADAVPTARLGPAVPKTRSATGSKEAEKEALPAASQTTRLPVLATRLSVRAYSSRFLEMSCGRWRGRIRTRKSLRKKEGEGDRLSGKGARVTAAPVGARAPQAETLTGPVAGSAPTVQAEPENTGGSAPPRRAPGPGESAATGLGRVQDRNSV